MRQLELESVQKFVEQNIIEFHNAKLRSLQRLDLKVLLKRKNPYLFRAKNITKASDLVEYLITAYLSSSEEELFGIFLEKLAVFVATQTCDVVTHAHTGIDLEFVNDARYHIVQIKSGPNWGNADQQRRLRMNFEVAQELVKKERGDTLPIDCVLGICYGKKQSRHDYTFRTLAGQRFWHFISGNPQLYVEIVEPIAYQSTMRILLYSETSLSMLQYKTS